MSQRLAESRHLVDIVDERGRFTRNTFPTQLQHEKKSISDDSLTCRMRRFFRLYLDAV